MVLVCSSYVALPSWTEEIIMRTPGPNASNTNTSRDDVRTPQRTEGVSANELSNNSQATISGLYRLSSDHRLAINPLRNELADTAERDDEYADPEIYEDTMEALLGGAHMREDVRLDVDGEYPQMTASGTLTRWLSGRIHWIAKLRPTGRFSWDGHIWFKEGAALLFPYTNVRITVSRALASHQRRATVIFTGGGAPRRIRAFRYFSNYFHDVNFEFDRAEGITPTTAIDTDAHPNRPATLPIETLSIDTVFRRAGFRVARSAGNSVPLIPGAGANAKWSDQEMHDAMQAYWSRYGDQAQWAMWTFFAAQHEMGPSLGGIMFDDIGAYHRQGTSLFYDSFISQPPVGETEPSAWVKRMQLWTAIHEMGHAFNLAHSWQKSLVFNGNGPWIPLADEPNARSFMNYPYAVPGGQTAFFSDFEYRFSDSELLFLRHAPEKFVQMGNADWFDNHGFEQVNRLPESSLRLQLRVNRVETRFEFMEPVMLELKLTNVSDQPLLLPDDIISNSERMTIIVRRQGQTAKAYLPYARYCRKAGQTVLRTSHSLYESLFVGAGRGGWRIDEPGVYLVQACLHLDNEDVLSNPLTIRVAPPQTREDELLAQDYFTEEVGRTLAFDGTRYFEQANNILNDVSLRLANRAVAAHAQIALQIGNLQDTKQLEMTGEAPRIVVVTADKETASRVLQQCLGRDADRSAETLGHIDYNYYVNRVVDALEENPAIDVTLSLAETLSLARQTMERRGVLPEITEHLRRRLERMERKSRAA
jgi:hypothetical protein